MWRSEGVAGSADAVGLIDQQQVELELRRRLERTVANEHVPGSRKLGLQDQGKGLRPGAVRGRELPANGIRQELHREDALAGSWSASDDDDRACMASLRRSHLRQDAVVGDPLLVDQVPAAVLIHHLVE